MQTIISWKLVQITVKKSSKFTKKITHVDNMMIYNLVKYLVQTRLHLWDIKITNLKPESCPDDLLETCYFYISQTKSILNKIFYKVMYHHIIYMYDFFGKFKRLFLSWFAQTFTKAVVCIDMFLFSSSLLADPNRTLEDLYFTYTR